MPEVFGVVVNSTTSALPLGLLPPPARLKVSTHPAPFPHLCSSATGASSLVGGAGRWVVSGGTGALGTLCASWLAAAGAANVVLLGRTSVATSTALPAEASVAGGGAGQVCILKCDVAAAADAAAAMVAGGLPLAAVLHAGGVLRDATLPNQILSGLRAVLAPKAAGAARLAGSAAAVLQPLHAIKLFSSVAAALGSGGQANYGAANALLDAAAQRQQQAGLPGLAVNWGAWAGAGMAAHAGEAGEAATHIHCRMAGGCPCMHLL